MSSWLLGLGRTVWMLPWLAGCESSGDTEPLVPAQQGAVQPEGTGQGIDESEACERLRDARAGAADRLNCDRQELRCPELIRPAGADPCHRYSYAEHSLKTCVDRIVAYAACDDFDRMPCVVTALVQDNAACGEGGALGMSGGAAGSNAGGASTEAAAGRGGASGAAGD